MNIFFNLIFNILNYIFLLIIILKLISFLVIHFRNNNNNNNNNTEKFINNNSILNIIIPVYNEEHQIIDEQIESILYSEFPHNSERYVYMICDGDQKSFNSITTILENKNLSQNENFSNKTYQSIQDIILEKKYNSNNNNIKKELFYYDSSKNINFIIILLEKNIGKFDILLYSYRRIKDKYYNHPNSYIIGLDSDTILESNAIINLYSYLIKNNKIIATGNVKVKNKNNLVEIYQSYDYQIMHDIIKQNEENIGFVSCMSGCIYILHFKKEFIDVIFNNFHKDNTMKTKYSDINKLLTSVGEDRFLTSIILKYFGKYSTGYCSTSIVYTYCPSTIINLLKQRNRWTNSINANLFYYEDFIYKEKNLSISFPIILDLILEYCKLSFISDNQYFSKIKMVILFLIIPLSFILLIKNIYIILFCIIFQIVFFIVKYKLSFSFILFFILNYIFSIIIEIYSSINNIFSNKFLWGTREKFDNGPRLRYKNQ